MVVICRERISKFHVGSFIIGVYVSKIGLALLVGCIKGRDPEFNDHSRDLPGATTAPRPQIQGSSLGNAEVGRRGLEAQGCGLTLLPYTPGEVGNGKKRARGRSPEKIENCNVRNGKWHNAVIRGYPRAVAWNQLGHISSQMVEELTQTSRNWIGRRPILDMKKRSLMQMVIGREDERCVSWLAVWERGDSRRIQC